jgi:ketosteroid isomerase-like protein
MSDHYTTIFMVLQAVAALTTICACSSSEVRNLIQKNYARYSAAFTSMDLDEIMAVLAQDFQWHTADGTVLDREATRLAIKEQLFGIKSVDEMIITIQHFTQQGDQVVVHTNEKLVATVRGDEGHLEQMTCIETYQDLWVKTKEGWKFKEARTLTSEVTTEPVESDRAA